MNRTRNTDIGRKSRAVQRFVGYFFLIVHFRCQLAGQATPITWSASKQIDKTCTKKEVYLLS